MEEVAKMVNMVHEKFPCAMTVYVGDKSIHISEDALREEFGEYAVSERDCELYKYEISVTIDGVKFYALTEGPEELEVK